MNDHSPRQASEQSPTESRDVRAMVFTDMVGSTKLKQEHGDSKASRLIDRHHRLLSSLVKGYKEGRIIDTAGDSFFVTFATPSDAVTFALQLQVGLRRLSKEVGCPLQDRVGIHSGEILQHTEAGTEKPDLQGMQVDTCARVMSLAGPNQVLMTRFVYDNARHILREEPIADVGRPGWASHGLFALKGIKEPVEICEVVVEGFTKPQAPSDSEKARRLSEIRPPREAELHAAIPRKPYLQRVKKATAWERRWARAGAAVATAGGLVLLFGGWLDTLSFDLSHGLRRSAAPQSYTNEVEIVAMDDESLSRLNQSYLREWDRGLHAQLLNRLAQFQSRAVVFDILFQTNRPAEDPAFLQAIRRNGKVAAAVDLQQRYESGYPTIVPVEPFEELRTNVWCGLTESAGTANLAIRRPRYAQSRAAAIWPWQSLAEEVVGRIDSLPKASPVGAWLNYYCPPDRVPVRSYYQVLSNEVPASVFSNKVVFVGSHIERRNPDEPGSDRFRTPYSTWGFPHALGVLVNATSYLNLKRGDWFVRVSPWLEFAGVLVVGIACGYLLFFLPPGMSVLAGLIAVVVALALLAVQLLVTRYWFPWLVVVLGQIPVAVLWSALMNGGRGNQKHA